MMKKLLAVLTCTTLLLCGCGKGSRTGATLEVDLTHSYASEPVDMKGIKVSPITVTDQGVIMEYWRKVDDVRLYLYDTVEKTYTEIEKTQTNAPAFFGQLPDGRLAALYDVSQGKKAGNNVYDGKTRIMELYDSDLHIAETQYLGEEVPEQVLCDTAILMDGDGYWYMPSYDEDGFYSLFVLNPDLTAKGTIPLESMTCERLIVGGSGTMYAFMTAMSEEQDYSARSHQLYRLDSDTMTAERLDDFAVPAYAWNVMTGNDTYELCYYDENGIYGVNKDGTSELCVDFINSDFPDQVYDCIALPNGEFIINYSDNNYTSKYYQLRPRTAEEIKNTQVLSLAGVALSHQLVQDVCKYNQSQLDYRIVIKDYATDYKPENSSGQFEEYLFGEGIDYSEAVEQFKNDLLGGVVPDIICMDNMPYQQLSNKGLLTDFAPMLEEDERFDPNQYHMNIFEGMKNGEKLEKIGFSFRISTAAAKTEFVGEQQGRTPEEYIDMINSLPEGMQLLPGTSQEKVLDCYLTGSQSAFIDRHNMTCSFTSESFIRLLELAGSLQTQEELYGDEEYWMWSHYTDNTLLELFDIEKPITYHDTHASTSQYEDITLVGFPDASGGN
ncbi:MAG: hypothetical protein K2I93_04830, partial [Oscillospiraceae bacterium]|nr:hypothetical protein [Oscillospiraceae bacterium]